MFCTTCDKDLRDCICEDREERLQKLGESPYLVTRWCVKCDKHYAACFCESPEWGLKSGGKIVKTKDIPTS